MKSESILFKPGTIGKMELKNRFVRSATVGCLATEDCRLTDLYLQVHEELAKGGVGLIITDNYYINTIGRAYPRIFVMDRDEMIEDLKKVSGIVHKYNAKIVAQLNHGGRQCDPKIVKKPIAPSPVLDKLTFIKPRKMTQNEIEETINDFGEAARRVKEAGFDGVQIHAAHGYLINEFLSAYTNRRKDKWGGSLENRMRFLIEVYQLIRSTVGSDYPILIKINCEDFISRGFNLDECIAVCKKLDELGIDAIEVSGGISEAGMVTIRGDIPKDLIMQELNFIMRIGLRIMDKSMRRKAHFEEAYFLPQASAIKKNVKVPVIAVGGMRHRSVMEDALESDQADFISMCRPFIRHPNLVNLMENDKADPITCNNCNRCLIKVVLQHKPLKCYRSDAK